jgi:hypothetical protein
MRYEQYRQVESSELTSIAHRRLIATIDTVDHVRDFHYVLSLNYLFINLENKKQLCTLMDLHSVEDKKALVKFAYAPLTIYSAVAATAKITKNRNILCLCNCNLN